MALQLQQLGPPEPELQEYKIQIPVRDGAQIDLKVHKPSSPPAGGSSLIVLSFGGGFVAGTADQP